MSDTTHTDEEIDAMERTVMARRAEQARQAVTAQSEAMQPYRDLVADGSVGKLRDVARAFWSMTGNDPIANVLRPAANAILVGIDGIDGVVAAMPVPAQPAAE